MRRGRNDKKYGFVTTVPGYLVRVRVGMQLVGASIPTAGATGGRAIVTEDVGGASKQQQADSEGRVRRGGCVSCLVCDRRRRYADANMQSTDLPYYDSALLGYEVGQGSVTRCVPHAPIGQLKSF